MSPRIYVPRACSRSHKLSDNKVGLEAGFGLQFWGSPFVSLGEFIVCIRKQKWDIVKSFQSSPSVQFGNLFPSHGSTKMAIPIFITHFVCFVCIFYFYMTYMLYT